VAIILVENNQFDFPMANSAAQAVMIPAATIRLPDVEATQLDSGI
jgi:hypothetical protein